MEEKRPETSSSSSRSRTKRLSPRRGQVQRKQEEDGEGDMPGSVMTPATQRSKRISPRRGQEAEREEGEGFVSPRPQRKRVSPRRFDEEEEVPHSRRPRRKRASPKTEPVWEGEEEEEGEEEGEGEGGGVSKRLRGGDQRRKSITMKLATSESKVIR